MPFVKLDCKILDSSLWIEKDQRDIFITALLMAEPFEAKEPIQQIKVRSLDLTEFVIPPGWYGFIPAAGIGIVRRAGLDQEKGLDALEKLGEPDPESRSNEFEGRRLIRVNGGFIALNYDKYRERDYTQADRQKRFRDRKKNSNAVTSRHVTQAEAEEEAYTKKEEIEIPLKLQTEEFKAKWQEWLIHRKQIRKTMTPASIQRQFKQFEEWGVDLSIKSINESIRNGWTGLFEPKIQTNGHKQALSPSASSVFQVDSVIQSIKTEIQKLKDSRDSWKRLEVPPFKEMTLEANQKLKQLKSRLAELTNQKIGIL